MVTGFNHNIGYRGGLFHVQTEDSGRANPHIVTLLYRGGTIIASTKTSYADIIKADQLELVVESIMKDQHKEMMRRLKGGEFDAKIFPGAAVVSSPSEPQAATLPAASTAAPTVASAPTAKSLSTEATPVGANHHSPAVGSPIEHPAPTESPKQNESPATPAKRSLDEVILDYLITGEEK
jgi:hypothetical protein